MTALTTIWPSSWRRCATRVRSRPDGSASLGLVDGQIYYVKLVSGNDKAIQLAATPGGAALSLTVPGASAKGVDTLDALTFATGCGACCGSCKPLALQVLDQARTEFDYAFAPAAA